MRVMKMVAAAGLLLGQATPALAEGELDAAIAKLGGGPCDYGELTCVTLPVARDHFANDPSQTIDVTFAISRAKGESKGVLFYVVGGPGGSGLMSADDYLSYFDASLTENMDIVFFDQRGTGAETGLTCPAANAAYDLADLPLDAPEAAMTAARTFVADCLAELGDTDLLPVVNTEQAIRDLEDFRIAIGAPQVWIYGESYGTQFAQQYATAFPAAIKGVILDGVVDLNLSFAEFYRTYSLGAERILRRMLDACDDLPACRADMQGQAAAVYDDLRTRLAAGPMKIGLPMGDGTVSERELTAGMLDANGFYALYGPDERATFLRVLAAASRGDYLPMLRNGYVNLAIDPATGESAPDPTWYGAAYYAITCTDYAQGNGDPDADARAILQAAAKLAPEARRLLRFYYAEQLACAYWPNRGPVERPAPFAGGDYPTLIMNADTDPITPPAMAYSVYRHARNAYLVVMRGGPHVIWGRGRGCPDRIVDALMFDGAMPEAQAQICSQDFIGAYEPLTLQDGAGDALELASALETEISQSPALYGWAGDGALELGCDFGGTVTVDYVEGGTGYNFARCGWWKDVAIDGTAIAADNGDSADGFSLNVTISGRHAGTISYRHGTVTEARSISGSYDGAEVSTPLPQP